jgi:membrane associated rhomboid family serine protease
MGIENREYLRGEESFGSFRGPRMSGRSIVVKIIIVTAVVFLLQVLSKSMLTEWLVLDEKSVFPGGQIWRFLTYAFCHSESNLLHIVINMYILYIMGNVVLRLMGEREFLWFYLVSAIFAGIVSVAHYQILGTPYVILGASGAVLAVFTLFALYYPRQKIYLFGVIPLEARWLLVIYAIYDGLPVLSPLLGVGEQFGVNAGGQQVCHSGHLGGMLFGYLYFKWQIRLSDRWDQLAGRFRDRSRNTQHLKVFKPPVQQDTDLPDKVDAILDKISREGEASLTERERRILTQASRQFRRDRS